MTDVVKEAEHVAAVGIIIAVLMILLSGTIAIAFYALGGGIVTGAVLTAIHAHEWNHQKGDEK